MCLSEQVEKEVVQTCKAGRKTGIHEHPLQGLQVPSLGRARATCGQAEHRGSWSLPRGADTEVARKVVNTRKRVLNLEWLRWQVMQTSSQVSELQARWLKNEERKRKRDYDDAAPVTTNPLSSDATRRSQKQWKPRARERGTPIFLSGTFQTTEERRAE